MNRTAVAECQLVARDFYERPANFYARMSQRKPNQSTIRAFIQSAGRPHTEAQKAVLAAKDDSTRGELKKRLPFWQVQSAPTGRGADAALEAPQNDVLILDIDCHDGQQLDTAAILRDARDLPFTLAIMRSASGRGLAILIAVSPELSRPWEFDTDIPKSSDTTEAAQAIVFEGARNLLDTEIDQKANNPERIRFQCASLEWLRDEDAPVVPYNAPDALDMIRASLGIPRAIQTPQEAAERKETGIENTHWHIHPIRDLATAYQGDAGPGSMGTAAAIATIAALVDIRTDVDGDVHAARARVVVLAYSGAGKSDMCDAMADATERHGIVLSNPKTTARLREDMRRAGTETVTNAEGEKGVTAKAHADHVLCTIDEAGDHLHQRTNDLSGLDLLGFFRELHGAHILLEGLKDAPSMRIPAAFTGILWSTPEQYARFSAEITGTDGENRRVLEFIEPKPETAKTGREALARRAGRRANEMMIAEIADAIAARFGSTPGETIRATPAAIDVFSSELYPELTAAGIDEAAAISLTFNYAAFSAAIRIARTHADAAEITPEDIRATACILRATAIRARAQLAEIEAREDDRKYKPENAVWCEIRDRIQAGKARKDKMLAWLSNRPPVYRETYDGMITRGEITADRDGKKYVLRFTTPEERETQTRTRTPIPTPSAGNPGGKPYADCDDAEKRKRLQSYISQFEKDNPIIEGQRDNNLRRLRGQLGKAGMSDEIGRQEFEALTMQRGLTKGDAARLWRQGNLQA